MKATKFVFVLFALLIVSGCAAEITVLRAPTADLAKRGKMFVVHSPPDGRHIEKIIKNQLTSRGYSATYGERQNIPGDVDIIVTYIDRWMWDITTYMLEITIEFKDAKTGILIASAKSYRTSLVRATPAEMIAETLDAIFLAK